MRIFLAGATGAIGRRLIPLLLNAGHAVAGTTRSVDKAGRLGSSGVTPVVVDMFDAEAVERAVAIARPEVVIHQLTDLPQVFDARLMADARVRNARLREVATPILMHAALAAGATRAIVQSICFAYEAGPLPHLESDPIEQPSVRAMEAAALQTPGIAGLVLRYGRLWGPGTWSAKPIGAAPLHVDAAVHAAFLALTRGAPGAYNIAEDDGTVSTKRAREQLGFDPEFRSPDRPEK